MAWTKEAGYNSPRSIITQIGVERAKKITVSDKISGGLIMKSAIKTAVENKQQGNSEKDAKQTASGTTQQTVSNNGHVYNQTAEKIYNIGHIENFQG